ncbi:MAG: winged helix-turn-helix domain-containing protein [Solirubrobacteraceae bacterium]
MGLRLATPSQRNIHLDLDRPAPLRAQLERELRQAIRAGRLRAGTKLPSSRLLAEELRVSRGVVVDAYSQLVAEGYLATRSGDGTRGADTLVLQPPAARASAAPLQRVRYDLRSGVPDPSGQDPRLADQPVRLLSPHAHARRAGRRGERAAPVCASVWREAPFCSPAERAAFALSEAVTTVGDGRTPDDVYRRAAVEFDPERS